MTRNNQSRINRRVAAAISRASRRYFKPFFFVLDGKSTKIEAIKRDSGDSEFAPIGGVGSARTFEFVVSAETFAALGVSLDSIRRAEIIEGTTRHGFVASRPYLENSPDGGSVRLFCYQKPENPKPRTAGPDADPTPSSGETTEDKDE